MAVMTQPSFTPYPTLDAMVARLRSEADPWARSPIAARLSLAIAMHAGYAAVAAASVQAGCVAKGIDFASPLAAEEWFAGPLVVLRNVRLLIETLKRLQQGLCPIQRKQVHQDADGRTVVSVFPASLADRLLFAGFSTEVWMRRGVQPHEVLDRAAAHYAQPAASRRGKVALVLGAGNVASIPSTDCLYKMFVEGKTCLLKMNPVNAHVGPFIERAFKAAVDRDQSS